MKILLVLSLLIRLSVYKQIIKNRPNINKSYALEVSRLIVKYSTQYKIDPNLYCAVLGVESAFKLNAVNDGKDFGIAQINLFNINSLKLDKNRLLVDLDYSIKEGASILGWFYKRYSGLGMKWVTKYNCGTKKGCEDWDSSVLYLNRIKKSLN